MGKRSRLPDHEANLLVTSGLILLICTIIAAMAYFAFSLEIIDPPGASDAPRRTGVSDSNNSAFASPDGAADIQPDPEEEEVTSIIFPHFVDFSITNGISTVELKNSQHNAVSLSFNLTNENGQVVYAAIDLQPGQSESWTVTDTFDPGTGKHDITVQIDAATLDDGESLNGIISTFTVDMG